MATEADTCRKLITPKLLAAGWEDEPHSLTEQRTFTDGRIYRKGKKWARKPQKRADYLLRYTRDFTIAVVEAKVNPAKELQNNTHKELHQLLATVLDKAFKGEMWWLLIGGGKYHERSTSRRACGHPSR